MTIFLLGILHLVGGFLMDVDVDGDEEVERMVVGGYHA